MESLRPEINVQRPRCPFCHDDVQPGDAKVACEACMAWHHAECLQETGGRCAACGEEVRATPRDGERAGAGRARGSPPGGLAPVLDVKAPGEAPHGEREASWTVIVLGTVLAFYGPLAVIWALVRWPSLLSSLLLMSVLVLVAFILVASSKRRPARRKETH